MRTWRGATGMSARRNRQPSRATTTTAATIRNTRSAGLALRRKTATGTPDEKRSNRKAASPPSSALYLALRLLHVEAVNKLLVAQVELPVGNDRVHPDRS